MTIKLLPIIGLACLAFTVLTDSAHSSGQKSSQPEQAPVQESSRKAYIDESTGELISVPSVVDTSSSKGVESTDKPNDREIEYITHADGTVEGRLDGHFQSELNVTLGCDGSLTQVHSDGGVDAPDSESLENCEESE